MSTPAAHLNVLVTANTKGATTGLMRLNSRLASTDAKTKTTAASMKALGKTAVLVGGAAGIGALAVGTKKAFGEFREAQKVTKQTNAVLKSTGNQAKVTAKEIENLAQKISLKAGIDDEAIQSGQNLLLTFTKIRNETGKGNQIFDRATQTITDMSVALGQDLKSSAIQVGKALQDPEKGVTALRRVGVSFNSTQQDLITKWLEHGKVLKAQKFILRELSTEFGGSAAAQADSADKLRVAWDNMFESIGKAIGPTIERVMAALATFINQMQSGEGAGGRFADKLRSVGQAAKDIVVFFKENKTALVALEAALITGTAAWVGYRAAVAAAAVVTTIATGGLNLIVPALAALAAALVVAYSKSETFRKIVNGAFANVKKAVQDTAKAFVGMKDGVVIAFDAIKQAANTAMRVFGNVMAKILRGFADLFELASHIPGIGGKFKDLAERANSAADRVDKLGEEVKELPKNKTVRITVDMILSDFAGGKLKPLEPLSNFGGNNPDGWGIEGAAAQFASRALFAGGGSADLMGANQSLLPFAALGSKMGLSVVSGLRPGAITRSGNRSMHADGRAIDVNAGSSSQMLAYAQFMASAFGPKLSELIHTPLGFSIKNGQRVPPYAQADHFDHVHVAMQRGGGINVPGHGTGDKVPVRAMVEPGERLFVLNRNAVPAFEAINNMFPRFQAGGAIARAANSPAQNNRILRRIRNLHKRLRRLYRGGITRGEKPEVIRIQMLITRLMDKLDPGLRGAAPAIWFDPSPGPDTVPAQAGGLIPGFASGGTVAKAAFGAGFRGSNLLRAVAESWGESRWNERAVGDGGASLGLMQIHKPSHPWAAGLNLFDPLVNMKAAMRVFRDGGGSWAPWHADHVPGLGRARAAIAAMGRGGPHAIMEDDPKWNWATMGNKRRGLWTLGGSHLVVGAKRFVDLVRRGEVNWGRSKHMLGDKSALKMFPAHRRVRIPRDPGGARDAFMTAFADQIAMRAALAALTPLGTDDLKVAQDAVRGWRAFLDLALKKKDQTAITTSAQNLKTWQDSLAELTGGVSALPADNSDRVALLQQLLQQANQRTAVSQAQYGVFRNMPSFAEGGVVPGYIGQPRVILAHGGETVTPVGAGGVQVIVNGDIVNTPRGKKPVEVRDIRGNNRAALPGRGGGLQRR